MLGMLYFRSSLLPLHLGKQTLKLLLSWTHLRVLGEAPGCLLRPLLALAVEVIWIVNKQIDFTLSLLFSLSFFEINISFENLVVAQFSDHLLLYLKFVSIILFPFLKSLIHCYQLCNDQGYFLVNFPLLPYHFNKLSG